MWRSRLVESQSWWPQKGWSMGPLMKLFHLCVLIAIVIGLLWMAFRAIPFDSPPSQDRSVKHYTPQFHAKQCFISNRMPRESWQPPVDGVVAVVGYAHYLVMYYDEADRRHGGAKVGWQEEMQTFDKQYHHITCPIKWAPQRHLRDNSSTHRF